ncbi:hypothetical protein KDM41_18125, partial [bacterium]|nr:hypothetical protein [bacterium]
MKSLFELAVGSFLVYPKGNDEATQRARQFIRLRIKMGRHDAVVNAVSRLASQVAEGPLAGFFPTDAVLVPIPGHTPRVKDGLWVADAICQEMVRSSLGSGVWPCLERIRTVPRSSHFVRAEDRASLRDHEKSLDFRDLLLPSNEIILIDDVVTRGTTLMAGGHLISERYPP